jgi:hypothetical protein
MSAALGDLICGIKESVSHGFGSLPAILGGALFILSLAQANFNLLFFFFGMWIVTPLWTFLLNGILEMLFSFGGIPTEFYAPATSGAPQCSIFSGASNGLPGPVNTVPSFWLSMMIFFYTYLLMNAIELYNMPPTPGAKEVQLRARKFKAATSISILLILGVGTIWLRYVTSNCESAFGVLISLSTVAIGYAWFKFMKNCGIGRLEDVFGITSRMIPVKEDTITCIPTS